jgi:chromosome segregation ATPase
MGEAGSAKEKADALEKSLSTRMGDVENKAKSVGDQVGRVEDRTSVLQTRTEAMEREFDRRTKQVEARTEELGVRTEGIKEREERVDQLSRIAFSAIFSSITSDVDALDRRIESAFYRLFSKGEAQRDVDSLRRRITELSTQLKEVNADHATEMLKQLEPLSQRLDQIATRIK